MHVPIASFRQFPYSLCKHFLVRIYTYYWTGEVHKLLQCQKNSGNPDRKIIHGQLPPHDSSGNWLISVNVFGKWSLDRYL